MSLVVRLLAVALLCATVPSWAQPQATRTSPDWPCQGRVDPSYSRIAEATGGKVMLFQPGEVNGLVTEMNAAAGHDQTITRARRMLAQGVHEVEVPIDSTIASVYFYVLLQCLDRAALVGPDGVEIDLAAPGVKHHAFRAVRIVTIASPRAGLWKVGVARRGLFTLVVSAGSALQLQSRNQRLIEASAQPQRLAAALSATTSDAKFRLLTLAGETLRWLELAEVPDEEGWRGYQADMVLPAGDYRLGVTGTDGQGHRFERLLPTTLAHEAPKPGLTRR